VVGHETVRSNVVRVGGGEDQEVAGNGPDDAPTVEPGNPAKRAARHGICAQSPVREGLQPRRAVMTHTAAVRKNGAVNGAHAGPPTRARGPADTRTLKRALYK